MVKEELETEINGLKGVQSLEKLVEAEDRIASGLGEGFLEGEFSYGDLMQSKERIEEIEEKCREEMAREKRPDIVKTAHTR